MKKCCFYITFFLLCGIFSFAQKPGYFGKRFIVGGEFSYGYSSTNILPLNFHYGGFADFTATNKMALGISYFHYDTKANNSNGNSGKISGNCILLRARFYRMQKTGAVAPIGKYFDAGISCSMNAFEVDSLSGQAYDPSEKMRPGNFIQLHLGAGIQTVWWDCISADAGVRIGIPPLALGTSDLKNVLFWKNIFNLYTRIGYVF